MIHFRCPKCNDQLSVPDSMAGQSETCPNCGNAAVVPQKIEDVGTRQVSQTIEMPRMTPTFFARRKTIILWIGCIAIGLIVLLSLKPNRYESMGEKELAAYIDRNLMGGQKASAVFIWQDCIYSSILENQYSMANRFLKGRTDRYRGECKRALEVLQKKLARKLGRR